MKRVVILSTQPPYGSAVSAEAFRAGLGLAFSEIVVDLILIGNGVYGLMDKQQPQGLQLKPMIDVYRNIAQFKINLYAESYALEKRGLDRAQCTAAKFLSDAEILERINSADVVLTF